MTVLSLLNPTNWFGQGRAKLSGGAGNEDRRDTGGGNYANKPVTLETALQLSAFWAAIKLTAETIGTLPLVLYERQADGGRAAARSHPLYAVLKDRPNADQTTTEFWEGMAAWMLTWGNGYSEIARRGDGQISSLLPPMPADRMSVRRDENGARVYRLNDRGRTEELPESKVFHLRGFGFAGDTGLSVIQYARQTLGSAMAAEEASGSTFANGMRPSGFFKAEMPNNALLTPEQRQQAREVLINPYTGAGNTARVGILEGPFSWLPVTVPAKDQELLATRGFNVEDVCRWVGIPPVLIGHASTGQTMWGSGIEQIMLGWLTLSLRAKLRRVQDSVNRALIAPVDRNRVYAEHVIDALLQADSKSRGEMYWKLMQIGAMTPNQVAQKENFPTFEGGDVRLINSTLMPLDKTGVDKIATKGGGPNADRPFDADEWKAFDPSKHPRDKNGMFSGRGARGGRLSNLAARAWGNRKLKDDVDLGRVDGARFSAAAGRDVEGWRFGANADELRHIRDQHGNAKREADRGQLAVTRADVEKIPQILRHAKAESITQSDGLTKSRKLVAINVEHEIGRARYRLTLEVQPGRRRRALMVHTMIKWAR